MKFDGRDITIPEELEDVVKEKLMILSREKRDRRMRHLAAGAGAAATILAGLGAAAYHNWSRSLSEGLKISETQMERMEDMRMAASIDQSCTDGGVTITAMQSITDHYFSYVAFKVEGFEPEEGEQPTFEQINITIDGETAYNVAHDFYDGLVIGPEGIAVNGDGTPFDLAEDGSILPHYVMEDGSLEYKISLFDTENENYYIGKNFHVEMKNLGVYGEKEEFEHRIDGTWSFDWVMEGSDEILDLQTDIGMGDGEAVLKQVVLSPISIQTIFEMPRQEMTEMGVNEDTGETFVHSYYEEPPVLRGVKMKDGTLNPWLFTGWGTYGYTSESSDEVRGIFSLDQVLDLDQVDSLLFLKSWPEEGEEWTEDNFYAVPLNSNR